MSDWFILLLRKWQVSLPISSCRVMFSAFGSLCLIDLVDLSVEILSNCFLKPFLLLALKTSCASEFHGLITYCVKKYFLLFALNLVLDNFFGRFLEICNEKYGTVISSSPCSCLLWFYRTPLYFHQEFIFSGQRIQLFFISPCTEDFSIHFCTSSRLFSLLISCFALGAQAYM